MSKILDATCIGGVVKVGTAIVPEAVIQSEGVASSAGVLVLDGELKHYIPKTSPDLKTTLEKIASALGELVTALTLIDAKPVGPLPPAPVAASNIIQLTALQAEVSALKEALR